MLVDWHPLGEVIYRKWNVYDMGWGEDFNIDHYMICGATFGGPIAFIKNKKTKITTTSSNSNEDEDNNIELSIYTSSGRLLSSISINAKSGSKIIGLGWSDDEQLMITFVDGNVIIYSIHGKLLKQFLLWDPSLTVHVLECKYWGNGIAVIASDMTIFTAENVCGLDNIRKNRFVTGLRQDRPHTAMAIIPPNLSRQGLLEVLLSTEDNSIIVVDENEIQDQLLQDRIGAAITKMSVAPNGRFVACYRRDGVLTVLSTTFTTKVLEFDTKSMSRPLSIDWCGEDSVVLLWRNTGIVMVGPYGDWLNFPYEGAVQVIAEHDCCRIITSTTCEILQRVPPVTEAIRKIGSTDAAALLFDAMEAYEAGDPKADENLRDIAASNQLVDAVQSCLQAAACEYEADKQQSLLRAASYGKAFCIGIDPTEFVDVAKKLRILNDIRSEAIGLPLTIQQYNRLAPDVLINRLILRNHHFLVLRICELLHINNSKVLIHWGSEKVKKLAQTNMSDDEICHQICTKIESHLEKNGHISYIEIAKAAFYKNKKKLAIKFIERETNASEQVPLLLSMQEDDLALSKAIQSEDSDLIYLAVIHLERVTASAAANAENVEASKAMYANYFKLIFKYPEATNLLKAYYRSKPGNSADRSHTLNSILLFNKNYMEVGLEAITQGYLNPSSRIPLLRDAVSLFSGNIPTSIANALTISCNNPSNGNASNVTNECMFYKSITEDQIDLLDMQKTLVLRSGKEFVDLTLSETLAKLYELILEFPLDQAKWEIEIQKLIKRFKIADKTIAHVRLEVYARHGQWDSLYDFACEKKSPIGYIPFARICIKYKQPTHEVEKYIEKVSSVEDKFDLYLEVQLWRKAAEVAYKMKDSQRLEAVARMCGSHDANLVSSIHEMLARM